MTVLAPFTAAANVHPVALPSLDLLLSDAALEPWTPANFLRFLQGEYNEENLLFYLEVDGLRALTGWDGPSAGLGKLAPGTLVDVADADRADKVTYLRAILAAFVVEKAPKQVNISHDQRVKILDCVDAEKAGWFEHSLSSLVEAQAEVKSLLQHGSWMRFYQKTMSQNMSGGQTRARASIGLCIGLVVLAVYAAFMALYVPRWYIFLLFLPMAPAVSMMFQSKTHSCPILAGRGLVRQDGQNTVIACPFVLASTRKRAKVVFAWSLVATAVLTLFMFSLTYAVEASRGQVGALYH